jgi:D-tyrosyl-tRNA(Tyr) deacylase
VRVDGQITGRTGRGLVVLLGVGVGDTERDADFLAEKIASLRIFPDEAGKMNLSVEQVGGGLLVVSQFTLYGDCRRGRRPSYTQAAPPEVASALYDYFVQRIRERGIEVATGIFQAMMEVDFVNDGPVTLLLDTDSH